MVELRRLLRLLDERSDLAPSQRSPLGLQDLDPLLDRMRAAGLEVTIETSGARRPLDPGIDLAAHRILQEGMTNALKHSGAGTAVRIELEWRAERLNIRIEDDGAGLKPPALPGLSGGAGLIGLRERCRVIGASLELGHLPGGGFRLEASLPTSPSDVPRAPISAEG